MRQVTGEIVLPESMRSFSAAVLHVYLEDVTQQDADARRVAETLISDVSHNRGQDDRVPFSLVCEVANEAASYSVRAHLDMENSGSIAIGDYVTTQSYPVLTYGHADEIVVQLKEVN